MKWSNKESICTKHSLSSAYPHTHKNNRKENEFIRVHLCICMCATTGLMVLGKTSRCQKEGKTGGYWASHPPHRKEQNTDTHRHTKREKMVYSNHQRENCILLSNEFWLDYLHKQHTQPTKLVFLEAVVDSNVQYNGLWMNTQTYRKHWLIEMISDVNLSPVTL